MSTPQSVTFNSRSFVSRSRGEFWNTLVSAMPIVIFYRGLRAALSR